MKRSSQSINWAILVAVLTVIKLTLLVIYQIIVYGIFIRGPHPPPALSFCFKETGGGAGAADGGNNKLEAPRLFVKISPLHAII